MTPASIFGALSQSNYDFHEVQISDWDKAVELGQMEPKSIEVAFGQNPTIFHLMGRNRPGWLAFTLTMLKALHVMIYAPSNHSFLTLHTLSPDSKINWQIPNSN
jgi:hypothetical protein